MQIPGVPWDSEQLSFFLQGGNLNSAALGRYGKVSSSPAYLWSRLACHLILDPLNKVDPQLSRWIPYCYRKILEIVRKRTEQENLGIQVGSKRSSDKRIKNRKTYIHAHMYSFFHPFFYPSTIKIYTNFHPSTHPCNKSFYSSSIQKLSTLSSIHSPIYLSIHKRKLSIY